MFYESGIFMNLLNLLVKFIGEFFAMSPSKIISELFGIGAVIISFFSYQMKTRNGILFSQTAASGLFSLHFIILGAPTLALQNVILIMRNLSYANRDKKPFSFKLLPLVFCLLLAVSAVLTWEGVQSLFVTVGLFVNTLCLTFSEPQNIRKSILVSSSLVIIYSIMSRSVAGVANEVIAISSSVIGIIRYRRGKSSNVQSF